MSFLLLLSAGTSQLNDPVKLRYPSYWPKPAYDFTKNPLTRSGVALGRRLFYDPILSRDSTLSCAGCHVSHTAFARIDHALSHGIDGRIGTRNAPALINLAWSVKFGWDGSLSSLEEQTLSSIAQADAMDQRIDILLQKLRNTPPYPRLFMEVYGDTAITTERLLKAISQFELTLVSANSKYDRLQQSRDTFTRQEGNGYLIFQKNCTSCHREPLFTHQDFEKNGLPADTVRRDIGRMKVTGRQRDSLAFKVPTLRNVEFSSPYMHDGRFRTLRDVINHYAETTALGRKMTLSPGETTDLETFLRTLTDQSFLYNKETGPPE
jgi:cytochrome c peroxidase